MTTLIIDNSTHRGLFRAGPWTAQYLKGEVDIHIGENGLVGLDIAKYSHVILTGSECSVTEDRIWILQQMKAVRRIIERGIPLLGICFGHQLIARAMGGAKCVRKSPTPEFGWYPIQVNSKDCALFHSLPKKTSQLCTHADEVVIPPPGFEIMAQTADCPVHAMQMTDRPVWGIQFHPEVDRTNGKQLLRLLVSLFPEISIDPWNAFPRTRKSNFVNQLFQNFQGMK
jgi:GMP synthase (glutamine-hydrolysing)